MSKATRNRARNARERIAAQQAAARRAEQRRRLLIVGGSVGLVVVIVIAFIVGKAILKPGKTLGSGHLPASVVNDITHVPPSTLKTVGTGAVPSPVGQTLKAITDKPLTAGGKPEMLYIGAEYCPYCAAMRWPMAVALSRFGTFGPLTGIHSSSSDVFPNTPTLTFYKQQYSSPYLTFTPVEAENGQRRPLQQPTKSQQALWAKYDTTQGQQSFPFLDFGNKAVVTGPFYLPVKLKGLTWAQVAGKLKNPHDPVTQEIGGSANYITAAICKMTGNKPGSVCTAAPIPAIEAKI